MKRSFLLALVPFLQGVLVFGQAPPINYKISTFAGKDRPRDAVRGTEAALRGPQGVAYREGALYVAESRGNDVLRLDTNGNVTVIAGTGAAGFSGDNGTARNALLDSPQGIAVDTAGNVYIADNGNSRIRKVSTDGIITTYAGNGTDGYSGDNGPATAAAISDPIGMVIDAAGNLIFSDRSTRRVRRISPTGTITTIAGTGVNGSTGDNGPATAAQLSEPAGLALDADGNLYIADYGADRIRKISPSGTITTIAGNGVKQSLADGVQPTSIGGPFGIAVLGSTIYFVEYDSNKIRSIGPSGLLSTVVGSAFGFSGDGGTGSTARIAFPQFVTATGAGVTFSDWENNRVRLVDPSGRIATIMGRDGAIGDGGPAAQAVFDAPTYLALDTDGTVVISDFNNFKIRSVAPNGTVSTLVGTGSPNLTFNIPLASVQLRSIYGLAVSPNGGNLRYASYLYNSVLGANGALSSQLTATLIANGSGASGYAGDGLAANSAGVRLAGPNGMAYDKQGNLYIADFRNHRVRRIRADTGIIETVAGNGSSTTSGDGGPATAAGLPLPADVAIAPNGDLLIATNLYIRRVDSTGKITTVVGGGNSTADFIAATSALVFPFSVSSDATGNIYFTELLSSTVKVVTTAGQIYRIAGTGPSSFSGDGGLARGAGLNNSIKVVVDAQGRVYVADRLNDRIRLLTPLHPSTVSIVSGNTQTAPGNTKVPNPLVVRVVAADGTALPDVPITFAVVSGTGTLRTPPTRTGANGTASVEVDLGNAAGPVVISATVAGLSPASFTLTATTPVSLLRPAVRAGGVITAGAFGASTTIAPGSWIEIYGSNLSSVTREWAGSDFNGSQAPRSLGGVKVTIGGQDAYIRLISATQINAQVPDGILPAGVSAGTAQLTVTTAEGTSDAVPVSVAAFAPGILAPWAAYTSKPYIYGAYPDGALVGPVGLISGVTFRPARAGDTITLFGVGFGATNPAAPAGTVVPVISPLATAARFRIGTETVTASFGGLIPGALGLYQFNIVVPQLAGGDQPFTILDPAGNPVLQSYVIPIQSPQ